MCDGDASWRGIRKLTEAKAGGPNRVRVVLGNRKKNFAGERASLTRTLVTLVGWSSRKTSRRSLRLEGTHIDRESEQSKFPELESHIQLIGKHHAKGIHSSKVRAR